MIKQFNGNKARLKRHKRVRAKISGTPQRPRLNVFRSAKHIYAQIIDDVGGVTLVSANTLQKEFTSDNGGNKSGNKEGAKIIGALIAERALKKGIKEVVFDRGGYLYHGRVAALAEGARSCGLII